MANRHPNVANAAFGPHIDVSVQQSAQEPESMCGGGAGAPDLAYTFEPVGTVPDHPCTRGASGDPRSIIAIPAGYEAVVLAHSPLYGPANLTRREIFLALAKWIPDSTGTVHENPNTTWRQIDAALGVEPIAFLGPPRSSAAGRSMIELLLEAGCQTIPALAALKSTHPDRYAQICRTVRTDGMYVEVSSLAPSRLLSEPNAVGIFAYRDLTYAPSKDLAFSTLDGVEPTLQGIKGGAYPGSRALYLYVNRRRAPLNVVMELLTNEQWVAARPGSALLPLPPMGLQSAFTEALGR
jgi:phosphate transport system substrate-binding protein